MKRRQLLRWGCGHCAAFGGLVQAQELPAAEGAASTPRFTRPDAASDEGGLWALMDREETRLRRSPFRMREDGLNKYLADIVCRLGGEHCPDIRVYAIRTPYFNASMAPNGMMQVWSGLLLRMENEAQLAAVLGHEIGHYLRRHAVERLRDIKARSAFGQIIGMFGLVGLVGQLATLAGALAFSREHEREADRIGIQLLQRNGYQPLEAAKVWQNLIDELRAIPGNDPAQNSVLFATHPGADERAQTLSELAAGMTGDTREAEYRAQVAPIRQGLLEDELKRGRLPESVALLNRMVAREPGSAELLHFRGEAHRLSDGDAERALALEDFQAALKAPKPLALTQRSLGYLYRSMQQPEAARAAWGAYLARAPDAPDAALIRQTLAEIPP
jgi:beta-barrel assembly-enhancing protease